MKDKEYSVKLDMVLTEDYLDDLIEYFIDMGYCAMVKKFPVNFCGRFISVEDCKKCLKEGITKN